MGSVSIANPGIVSAPMRSAVARRQAFFRELEDRAQFARSFDHLPFEFRHALDQFQALQTMALREGGLKAGKQRVSLAAEVVKEIVASLSAVSGVDVHEVYEEPTVSMEMNAPRSATPYRLEGELNVLVQLRGSQRVFVYDGEDKGVLSEETLERFWTGEAVAEELAAKLPFAHWQFGVERGQGVIVPPTFPYWLQSGDEVSVALTIGLKRKHSAKVGAHRLNRYLRRLGVTPKPVGEEPSTDRLKEIVFGRAYEALVHP